MGRSVVLYQSCYQFEKRSVNPVEGIALRAVDIQHRRDRHVFPVIPRLVLPVIPRLVLPVIPRLVRGIRPPVSGQ